MDGAATWSPLVLARSEGSEPPLFVVHDVGGEVVYTRLLATLLPEGFPIYGLRGQALQGRMIPERSIEELAGRYAAAMRTVSPHGPYRLYGASAGGTIAFEIARQLRRAGEDVPVLVLGDSIAPGTPMKWGRSERAAARARELKELPVGAASRYVLRIAARQLAFRAHRVSARVTGDVRSDRARRAADNELMQAAAKGGTAVPPALRTSFAVLVYGWMTVAYKPDSPYDGPLTVLRCPESRLPVEPWNRYVTSPAKQVPVSRRHIDLGTEAAVREVAAVLTTEIGLAANG